MAVFATPTHELVIRRRRPRRTPLRSRRIGPALALAGAATAGGSPAPDFPGLRILEPGGARGRLLTGLLSLLCHGALVGALVLVAWLAPVEELEELIKVDLIRERDEVVERKPAPAPRVVAEARGVYAPAPMAVTPQVVSPAVIQQAAPMVAARKLDMEALGSAQVPRQVERASQVVERASTYQSNVQVSATPVEIEASAPAIRGPVEIQAPSGIQAGPRQVVPSGAGVGIADPQALGTGSAVREGIASSRDVLGAKTGARAEVNWAVGDSNLRGSGGDGTGPGGTSWAQCQARPEVQAYMERVKQRMRARWILPPDAPGNREVKLRFVLDPAGTATSVQVVSSADAQLGESAVEALRSASPFDHMPDSVRCLAGPMVGTFRNPLVTD